MKVSHLLLEEKIQTYDESREMQFLKWLADVPATLRAGRVPDGSPAGTGSFPTAQSRPASRGRTGLRHDADPDSHACPGIPQKSVRHEIPTRLPFPRDLLGVTATRTITIINE